MPSLFLRGRNRLNALGRRCVRLGCALANHVFIHVLVIAPVLCSERVYVCVCVHIRYQICIYIYMEVHVHIQYVLIQFYTSIGEYHARTAIDVPRDVCTHKQADVTA